MWRRNPSPWRWLSGLSGKPRRCAADTELTRRPPSITFWEVYLPRCHPEFKYVDGGDAIGGLIARFGEDGADRILSSAWSRYREEVGPYIFVSLGQIDVVSLAEGARAALEEMVGSLAWTAFESGREDLFVRSLAQPQNFYVLGLLIEHPDWTNIKIAETVGVSRKTLSESPRYQKFRDSRKALKSGREKYRKDV